MIRAGWDHDGFRRLKEPDTFSWPDDPLRVLHENAHGHGHHGADACCALASSLEGE